MVSSGRVSMSGVDGVTVRIEREPGIVRWHPFVRWLLCLPHLVLANVYQLVSVVVSFAIAANVLVNGRVPAGLAAFQVTSLRERVRAYGYFFLLREPRPPLATTITAEDPGDDPLSHVTVAVPAVATRASVLKRPLTLLLHLLPLAPLAVLLDVLYPVWMLVAAWRGSWPAWFARLLLRTERWVAAVVLYVTYATNEAPAFGLRAYAQPGDPA